MIDTTFWSRQVHISNTPDISWASASLLNCIVEDLTCRFCWRAEICAQIMLCKFAIKCFHHFKDISSALVLVQPASWCSQRTTCRQRQKESMWKAAWIIVTIWFWMDRLMLAKQHYDLNDSSVLTSYEDGPMQWSLRKLWQQLTKNAEEKRDDSRRRRGETINSLWCWDHWTSYHQQIRR